MAVNGLSLMENMLNALQGNRKVLMIVGDNALCFFRDMFGRFCLFDSHSRNVLVQVCQYGRSICGYYSQMDDWVAAVERLSGSLARTPVAYEMKPIIVNFEVGVGNGALQEQNCRISLLEILLNIDLTIPQQLTHWEL